MDVLHDGSVKLDGENQKDSSSALIISSEAYHLKHRRSFSKWNDDISQAGSTLTETTRAGELISGSSCASKLPIVCSNSSPNTLCLHLILSVTNRCLGFGNTIAISHLVLKNSPLFFSIPPHYNSFKSLFHDTKSVSSYNPLLALAVTSCES